MLSRSETSPAKPSLRTVAFALGTVRFARGFFGFGL
jgi:hypothetical protein